MWCCWIQFLLVTIVYPPPIIDQMAFDPSRGVQIKQKLFLFLTLLVPNYIAVSYSVDAVDSFNRRMLSRLGITPIPDGWEIAIVITAIVLIPIAMSSLQTWFVRDDYRRNLKLMRLLIHQIDDVVNAKRRRFSQAVKRDHIATAGDVFLTITRPAEQITELLSSAIALFRAYLEEDTIKGSVIYCTDKRLENFFVHVDGDASISIEDLRQAASAAERCRSTAKTIVVEDTRRETEGFVADAAGKTLSLCCFPVVVGPSVRFVPSLTSKESSTFRRRRISVYSYVLERFAHRVTMESYLFDLKERIIGQEQEAREDH